MTNTDTSLQPNHPPKQGDKRGSRQWMTADAFEYNLLKENAKANRHNMTEAESAFWSMVRGGALGERCIRQHVIGDYIVDFLFRKSKLIVEIDGGYHRPKTPPSPLFRGGPQTPPTPLFRGEFQLIEIENMPMTKSSEINLPPKQGDREGLNLPPKQGDREGLNLPPKQGDRGGLWVNDPEQIERDRVRQDWLEHMGYKVIRFTNEEVLCDPDNTLQKVKASLNREVGGSKEVLCDPDNTLQKVKSALNRED